MKRCVTLILSLLIALSFSQGFATQYESDPSHTFAIFKIKHANTGYTYGNFDEMYASLDVTDDVTESSIYFEIIVDSVDTGTDLEGVDFDGARRDGHLRSPDFFDAAQFPVITFESTAVATTDDENVLEVTGNLSIHGVTNSVTVMVEKTGEMTNNGGKHVLGYHTEFSINRTDYGMNNLLAAAGDEVTIIISFEGVEQ